MAKKINFKKDTSVILTVIIAIIALFKIYVSPNIESTPIQEDLDFSSITEEELEGNLKIHYIDVGQADSILITLNDKSMLIDAGNNADGELVVNYIKNQGVETLDYLVGTHAHEDHIGGMDNVIKAFKIKNVFMPKVQHNTKTFEEVLDALKEKNLKVKSPKVGETYDLSDGEFTILSCRNGDVEELNLSSIVLRLVYKNQSYIFCGDAEKENEYDMLNSGLELKSNVIKIGHHGSVSSSTKEFLEAVNPEVAVICTGKGNKYGHPHRETLKTLKDLDIKTYRTDLNGNIVLVSDGNKNKIIVSKEG